MTEHSIVNITRRLCVYDLDGDNTAYKKKSNSLGSSKRVEKKKPSIVEITNELCVYDLDDDNASGPKKKPNSLKSPENLKSEESLTKISNNKEISAIKEQCQYLNEHLKKCKEILKKEKDKNCDLEAKHSSLQKNKNILEKENNDLKEKLSASSLTAKEISAVKEQCQYLNQHLKECKEFLKKEKTKNCDLEAKRVSLLKIRNTLERGNNDLKEKLSASSLTAKEICTIKKQYQDLNQQLNECKESLKKEKAKNFDFETKCTSLQENKNNLEKENNDLKEKLSSSHSIEKKKDEYCKKLQKQLQDANKLAEDQKSKIKQFEKNCVYLNSVKSDLGKKLEAEKEFYKVLSEKHVAATSEIKILKGEKQNCSEKYFKEVQELQLRLSAIRKKCQGQSQQLKECKKYLDHEIVKFRELKTTYITLQAHNNTLEEKKNNLEEKLSTTLIELDEASTEIKLIKEKLQVQIDSRCKAIEASRLSLSAAQEKHSRLLNELQEKHCELLNEMENKNSKISNLEQTIKKLKKKCIILTDKYRASKVTAPTVSLKRSRTESESEDNSVRPTPKNQHLDPTLLSQWHRPGSLLSNEAQLQQPPTSFPSSSLAREENQTSLEVDSKDDSLNPRNHLTQINSVEDEDKFLYGLAPPVPQSSSSAEPCRPEIAVTSAPGGWSDEETEDSMAAEISHPFTALSKLEVMQKSEHIPLKNLFSKSSSDWKNEASHSQMTPLITRKQTLDPLAKVPLSPPTNSLLVPDAKLQSEQLPLIEEKSKYTSVVNFLKNQLSAMHNLLNTDNVREEDSNLNVLINNVILQNGSPDQSSYKQALDSQLIINCPSDGGHTRTVKVKQSCPSIKRKNVDHPAKRILKAAHSRVVATTSDSTAPSTKYLRKLEKYAKKVYGSMPTKLVDDENQHSSGHNKHRSTSRKSPNQQSHSRDKYCGSGQSKSPDHQSHDSSKSPGFSSRSRNKSSGHQSRERSPEYRSRNRSRHRHEKQLH